ncbi:MAG TPA: 50S ribosomal protein L15 [Candidatus Limnocylindria bacterium]
MKLHDLQPATGSHTPARRVGRGHGSGKGKTAGRGTKGQKSRAGGSIPPWFEGGQTPLHIRTPKLHGFRNRGRVAYAAVNIGRLVEAEAGTLITPDVLAHGGLVRRSKTRPLPVKILGAGDAPKGVTIHAHAFSRAALDKLAAAGSTAQRISWPDGMPVDEAAEARALAESAAAAETRARARGKRRSKRKGQGTGTRAATGAAAAAAADDAPDAPATDATDAPATDPTDSTAAVTDNDGSEPEEADGEGATA